MGFVAQNLSANETINYEAKLHWWVFAPGIFVILLGLMFSGASGQFGGFLIFIGVVVLGFAYLNFSSSEFAITNKRVIMKTGIISRNLAELQLNKAEGLAINQGIFGRMLNFGSVNVGTGGRSNSYGPIADPFGFKREINEAVEQQVR